MFTTTANSTARNTPFPAPACSDRPAVQFNQLCITQEQLEQIRALRAVPEPEQLMEKE